MEVPKQQTVSDEVLKKTWDKQLEEDSHLSISVVILSLIPCISFFSEANLICHSLSPSSSLLLSFLHLKIIITPVSLSASFIHYLKSHSDQLLIYSKSGLLIMKMPFLD